MQKNKKATFSTDILILGAGIAGYAAFRELSKNLKKNKINKTITIVDQNNYFTFTPLLHEVASGSVEATQATFSLRELVYKTPHQFQQAAIEKILPDKKIVQTNVGEISYQYCIIALGSGVKYYNITGAREFSYSVRTLQEALFLRRSLIKKLETNPKKISINIVGGGYTGVEVAGQFSSLVKHDLKKLYPKTEIEICIIQASNTLVSQLPVLAQKKIINRLKKIGIKIFFNSSISEVREREIIFNNESHASDITIWCAGVDNFGTAFVGEDYCERGRLSVDEFLQINQFPETYAIGDIACSHNQKKLNNFPQIGEVAHMQGEYVSKNLIAKLLNKKIKQFQFESKGTLMPIGDFYGLAVFGKNIVLSGFFAWWLRRTVYLMFMPGKLRKLKIMINWTLNMFGFKNIIDIS